MINQEKIWLSIIRDQEEGIIITLMAILRKAKRATPRKGIYHIATMNLYGKANMYESTERAIPGEITGGDLCLACVPERTIPGLLEKEIGTYFVDNFEIIRQRSFIEYQNIWLKLKQKEYSAVQL